MLTEADFRHLHKTVSNTGRWSGRAGALNLITPEVTGQALHDVTGERIISLGHSIGTSDDEASITIDRSTDHMPGQNWKAVNETLTVRGHGRGGHTHADALGHFSWDRVDFEGRLAFGDASVPMLDITAAAGGIVTRGIFVDLSAAVAAGMLEAGAVCDRATLEQIFRATGVEPRSGDALLVRLNREGDALAGLALDCAEWVHSAGITIAGSDAGFESEPSEAENVMMPWHILLLTSMGVHLLDALALDELAAVCAQRQTWTFAFVLAVAAIEGSTSATANPLAIF